MEDRAMCYTLWESMMNRKVRKERKIRTSSTPPQERTPKAEAREGESWVGELVNRLVKEERTEKAHEREEA